MSRISLSQRVQREAEHGLEILKGNEENWGWHTDAGKIRKKRRTDFLNSAAREFPKDAAVLEVGCGSGTFTRELATAYKNLVSIDVSEPLLDVARSRYPGCEFQKADIHQSSFQDAQFDVVLGSSVLHHLDWDLALKEIHRILKPGGQIRFSEPNLLNPQIFLQKNVSCLKRRMGDSPDEYAFTAGQIRRSLQRAGFLKINVRSYEFLHPSTPVNWIPSVMQLERWLERLPFRVLAGSLKIQATR